MSSVSTTPSPLRRNAWKIRLSASLLRILRSLTMVILIGVSAVCFGITTLPVHSEMVSMSVLISWSRNCSPTSSSVTGALRPDPGPRSGVVAGVGSAASGGVAGSTSGASSGGRSIG